MNNYVSPVIFDNDELTEGVYATGSGGGADCWTVTKCQLVQDWENSRTYAVYELGMYHDGGHDTTAGEFTGIITGNIEGNNVYITTENADNIAISLKGNQYVVTRTHHANMEFTKDEVTFKLFLHSKSGGVVLQEPMPTNCRKSMSPNGNY